MTTDADRHAIDLGAKELHRICSESERAWERETIARRNAYRNMVRRVLNAAGKAGRA